MMCNMNTDFERLLEAAKKLHNCKSSAAAARLIGTYDQMLTNWKSRGLPRADIMDIASKLGCNPYWLRDGTGSMTDPLLNERIKSVVESMQTMPTYKMDLLVQICKTMEE